MAFRFNGALSVSELLGSAFLFASARRILLSGEGKAEEFVPDDPERERFMSLAARSRPLDG